MKKSYVVSVVATALAILSGAASADVAGRVTESGLDSHSGVLAYVHDASSEGMRYERKFFGQGMQKVAEVSAGLQVQIVEPEDVPGGALKRSWVVLTPDGRHVVALQRGYEHINDLRAFVAVARGALAVNAASQGIATKKLTALNN